jgi:hypothetical protein
MCLRDGALRRKGLRKLDPGLSEAGEEPLRFWEFELGVGSVDEQFSQGE